MNTESFNMGYKEKISNLITDDVAFILKLLESNGYETRIVGGAVRNLLLGTDIADIDMATTALPNELIDVCDQNGIKCVPSGINHGTVTLVYNGRGYEVTTLRKDIETFGRRAKVSFCRSFEEDSNRRDFTINALYMDKNGIIYDYHEGISDIAKKNVRFIGDARTRIAEDYLRILRYFRFVAYYGNFQCNKEYLSIIYEAKSKILSLSSERILGELLRILTLRSANKIIDDMIPVLDELFSVKCNSLNFCIDSSLSNVEKLCLLLKFSDRSLNELIKRYKFPKRMKRLLQLPDCSDSSLIVAKKYLKQIHKEDRSFFVSWFVIERRLSKKFSERKAKNMFQELKGFIDSEYINFNLRASDLTEYNLSENYLRKIMTYTKKIWLSSNKNLSTKDCKKIAEDVIRRDNCVLY